MTPFNIVGMACGPHSTLLAHLWFSVVIGTLRIELTWDWTDLQSKQRPFPALRDSLAAGGFLDRKPGGGSEEDLMPIEAPVSHWEE